MNPDLTAALAGALHGEALGCAEPYDCSFHRSDAGAVLARFLADPRTADALARAIYAAEDRTGWELNVSEEMLAAAILAALRDGGIEEAIG